MNFQLRFWWRKPGIVGFLIAGMQSILFFRNLMKYPVHVTIPYNKDFDVSAEAEGVKFIEKESFGNRKYETYEHPTIKLDRDKVKKYIGCEYDYFLYPRWWWKISTVQIPVIILILALINVLPCSTSLIILFSYAASWFPVNIILKRLSKNRWACSENAASVFWDHGGDFGYGTRFSAASPVDEYAKVKFANWKLIKKGGI